MEQVSSQLLALGYLQEPLSANSRSTALKQLEQAVHKLLAASKTDAQFRESLSSSQRELSFERGRLQDQLEKALRDLDHAQKEQKLAQNVKDQAVKDLEAEKKAHSQTRDDLTKNRLALQYVKSTAAQESKRKEREWAATLNKISGPSSASLVQSTQARAPTPSLEGEKALLETALEDLEGIRQALLAENEQFRITMGQSLSAAEEAVRAAGASPRPLSALVPDIHLYPEPHLTLPPHVLSNHLHALLEQAQSRLGVIEQGRQQAEEEATQAEQTLNVERINGHKHIADLQVKIVQIEQEATSASEQLEKLNQALDKANDTATRAKKKYKAEQEKSESLKSELSAKEMAFQMERRQFALDSKSTTSVKPPSDQEQRSSLSLKSKSKLDTDNGPTADKGPSTSAKPSVRKDKRKRPPSPQSAPSKRQQSESTLPKAASATLADVLFNSPKAPKTSTHVNCIEDDVHTKENRKHTNREGKRPHKSSRSASRDE